MKALLTLTLASVLVAITAVAGAASSGEAEALTALVRQDCGSCHGLTLQGGLGPALTPEALEGKPDEMLITAIMKGRPAAAMPPWEGILERDEARWIVEQLKAGLQ
ncbi:MAG: cytochrome c [Gammaproteobacteria bacterium]|nr:cytochrome c [Gammaproteobacteria bacterium]